MCRRRFWRTKSEDLSRTAAHISVADGSVVDNAYDQRNTFVQRYGVDKCNIYDGSDWRDWRDWCDGRGGY